MLEFGVNTVQVQKKRSGTEIDIYVAHNIALLIVNFGGHIRETERIME